MSTDRYSKFLLRQGRKVGRTLYFVNPDNPDGDGVLVGMVDSADLAERIVSLWNAGYVGPVREVKSHMREID